MIPFNLRGFSASVGGQGRRPRMRTKKGLDFGASSLRSFDALIFQTTLPKREKKSFDETKEGQIRFMKAIKIDWKQTMNCHPEV